MDLRVAKTFAVGDRVRLQALFEFFNLFNSANPAAVNLNHNHNPLNAGEAIFGSTAEYLPGREGQFGLRLTF
jgi:hypothetical protein